MAKPRILIVTLVSAVALVAVGAAALLGSKGVVAVLCAVGVVATVALGVVMAMISGKEAEGAAKLLKRMAEELSAGTPTSTGTHVTAVSHIGSPDEEVSIGGEMGAAIRGLREQVEVLIAFVNETSAFGECFAEGRLPDVFHPYRGKLGEASTHFNKIIGVIKSRNDDVALVVEAIQKGTLVANVDLSKYSGYNGKILELLLSLLANVRAPVIETAAVLERLAKRDLTARMTGTFSGEFGRLKDALNATAVALHDAVALMARATDEVSGAASQIAASSQSLAAGASQQASSLEETSSSLESMTSMVKTSADNAQQASALALSAKTAAGEGATAMQQMAGAMDKIRASAEGTSQIIKDINDIAFQTNLLALNAAVEAARAGAAGRGFAVVAEEVRSLALRSKEAANKTEALIQESVKQSGEGDATAKLVAGKLAEITGIVGKVTDIVGEIAASAREQATGIDQVTTAVTEMNKLTQQNAASSEESSSAAMELSSQSEELAGTVGAFRLDSSMVAKPLTGSKPAVQPAKVAMARPQATQAAKPAVARPTVKPATSKPVGARPAAAAPPAAMSLRKGGASSPAKPNSYALKPEEIIPLESDPSFEDF